MDFNQVISIAKKFADDMPEQIVDRLADVEILVCEDTEKARVRLNEILAEEDGEQLKEGEIPLDCKGVFIGDPAEVEESDESEEEEMEYDPSGWIVLCVNNIANPEECAIVLMHEFAHALGMDEDEVRRLGLAGPLSTPQGAAPNATQPSVAPPGA